MTPNWHEYAGKMALYERGWTDTLIREHLPPPEARGGDLCALVGRPPDRGGMNPFWKWKTILKIEPTIADKLASNIPNGYTHAARARSRTAGGQKH